MTIESSQLTKVPKVIGYVPAFNAEKFILATLEALSMQTYMNFEIWICDDASTDRTLEICDDFCQKDPRFKLFRNENNLGWWRNSIHFWKITSESSDYCFFNPHDDIPKLNFISEQVVLLEKNPEAILCVPGMKNTYENGTSKDSIPHGFASSLRPEDRLIPLIKLEIPEWWAAYHGLLRSSFVPKILPIEPLRFGEKEFALDLVWLIRAASFGPFVCSDEILFEKVYTKKNLSIQWKYSFTNRSALYLAICEVIFKLPLSLSEKRIIFRAVLQKISFTILNKIPLFKKVS
ncbi:glycosyltransferase family 2 protein [Algoriphagus sp. A40]|uniref:glycosyltransferase family 2 protein n=1 Tax=Algoriphagus sp. A40 TaxID=1945863 RepID=UPI0009D37E17|nr:glycosyltransferase family 2 protein [Algoriphagus sp. A40]OOG78846.1 hypothetical protein B0E43_00355 [Algoriphagus sp. A40]